MNNRDDESFHLYCARMARDRGDNSAAHMREFLHASESGESLNSKTMAFFVKAFKEFLRYQNGHPDSPAQETREALCSALEVPLRKRGRPNIDAAKISTQFRLAWQVQVLHSRATDRESRSVTVEDAITLVAGGMGQTFDVVKTARYQLKDEVLKEDFRELTVFEDWVVPRRRSAEIASQLVEFTATPIDRSEITLPLDLLESDPDRAEICPVLHYPPSTKALGQMMIWNGAHSDELSSDALVRYSHEYNSGSDYLARVLAACSKTPQEVFKMLVEQMDALALTALGERILSEVVENSKTDV